MKNVVFRQFFQKVFRYTSNLGLSLNIISKMPYYAVAKGRKTGIFMSWPECESQVKGFSGAKYKKFDSEQSALDFIGSGAGPAKQYAAQSKPAYKNNNYSNNTLNSTTNRSYSTTSSNYQRGGKSKNFKPKPTYDEDSDASQSSDDIETMLNKQMDDIEKRPNVFGKRLDKIMNTRKRAAPRGTILIDPPEAKRSRRDEDEFEVDSDGYVQVYTDGACSANGRSGAKAGIGVYWGEGHHLNVSEPVSGRATNNCGEIQAATRAIQQAVQNGTHKLTINTDSQFLINAVTKWMPGWKRKGWKLASGEPVKNETDFKELDAVQNNVNIKWNYVEAHRGVHGNEMADQLAKAGAARVLYEKFHEILKEGLNGRPALTVLSQHMLS